jgi:hypothetical protein
MVELVIRSDHGPNQLAKLEPSGACVFTSAKGRLGQSAELSPADGIANANFGEAVGASNNTVVIGHPPRAAPSGPLDLLDDVPLGDDEKA